MRSQKTQRILGEIRRYQRRSSWRDCAKNVRTNETSALRPVASDGLAERQSSGFDRGRAGDLSGRRTRRGSAATNRRCRSDRSRPRVVLNCGCIAEDDDGLEDRATEGTGCTGRAETASVSPHLRRFGFAPPKVSLRTESGLDPKRTEECAQLRGLCELRIRVRRSDNAAARVR